MLDCPNCGEFLTPINIATPGGGKITVDHCTNCGGTWFDAYEINRISYQDVFKIAASTSIKKNVAPWGKLERLCPRDFHNLEKFKQDISSENLDIERCPHCHGIFIFQKDLERFKLAQSAKINIFKKTAIPFPSLAAVFIPIFFVGLLLFSTFLTVTNLQNAKEAQIKAQEQITAVTVVPITSTSVSILYLTQSPTLTQITYQTNFFDSITVSPEQTPQTAHNILLKNLKPNSLYHFRISLILPNGAQAISNEYTFTTSK